MQRSRILFIILSCTLLNALEQLTDEKAKFCSNVESQCRTRQRIKDSVCGLRPEEKGFGRRVFASLCDLLQYNCRVKDAEAYLIVKEQFCKKSSLRDLSDATSIGEKSNTTRAKCAYDCTFLLNTTEVCAIRSEGDGFRLRWFTNQCEMLQYNCENIVAYTIEADHVCKDLKRPIKAGDLSAVRSNERDKYNREPIKPYKENVVIVDGSMFNTNGNINDTVDNFFAATHLMDMPVREVSKDMFDGETRRRLIKIAGPIMVFKPAVVIPEVVNTSYEYAPTLGSCYHKCPEKCPDTYQPVCGTPGLRAREPSIVFLNHCYMDAAQCKMKYDKGSTTYNSSFYTESTFLFCMGETMNSMYRFLPVLRTLQHMGRLKRKGYYRYKIENMRFYNKLLLRNPNFMG